MGLGEFAKATSDRTEADINLTDMDSQRGETLVAVEEVEVGGGESGLLQTTNVCGDDPSAAGDALCYGGDFQRGDPVPLISAERTVAGVVVARNTEGDVGTIISKCDLDAIIEAAKRGDLTDRQTPTAES